MSETQEKYLSVAEFAEELGVSKWTVYRKHKNWPKSLVGGSVKFSPENRAAIKDLLNVAPPVGVEADQGPKPALTAKQKATALKRLGLIDGQKASAA